MIWNRKLSFVLMIVFTCLTLTVASASDVDDAEGPISHNVTDSLLSDSNEFQDVPDTVDIELDGEPDVPDLSEDADTVTPSNIQLYFQNGVLKNQYSGKKLIFSGNFDNLGILSIKSDDVSILGRPAFFKNTVFNVGANGVVLNNLTFDLNKPYKDNDGAAIFVEGYDVSLIGLNINYVVPNDVEAYAIYANGYIGYSSENLKIINSTIYFEGHNENVNKYNCAIKLANSFGPIIENNTIVTSLPLKNVKYGPDGATLDSDFVYSLGLEECHEFIVRNNTIINDVNKRPAVKFPTQNCIMLSKSDDGLFVNNSVYMTDFVTYPGTENYIYGLDIYKLNNLLVSGNKISIVTTGGKLALGTAYPIQICGPITGVKITGNDLYSFSNGPNIGIYSQNFYGETELSITNNKINVTGLAGTHEWALVTGIESQDSNAEILNNTIEVHSVSTVNIDDNLYAISYRQSTSGTHSFNIQGNTAFTDGYYGIYLLSSDNSIIANNILISSNDGAVTGSNAYAEGFRTHNGDKSYNNIVMRLADYYNSLNNINMGQNNGGNGNHIQWGGLPSANQNNNNYPNSNPIVPHYSNNQQNSPTGGTGSETGYIDDGSVQGNIGDDDGKMYSQNSHRTQNSSSDNQRSDVVSEIFNANDRTGVNEGILSNSSDATPSVGSDNAPLSQSQSQGSSSDSQSVSKAFEIDEIKETEDFIPSIFFIIAALVLLIVGYSRKDEGSGNN